MRDTRIDFLRFTGLMMIILAHVSPPEWLFQFRNFDVPLMVLISGLSYRLSVKNEPYAGYVWSRVQRLVFPVWIFLTVFFSAEYLITGPFNPDDIQRAVRSYLLLDGIGYVWIIRVFLLVALLAPFAYFWHIKQRSNSKFLGGIALLYVAYEWLSMQTSIMEPGIPREALQQWVYLAVPYVLLFSLGLRLPDLSRQGIIILTLFFASVYVGWLSYYAISTGQWVQTQQFKYPPTSYYLSFALMMGCFLYLTSHLWMQLAASMKLTAFVLFVGANSIWIYLWHILFLRAFEALGNFAILYIAVSVCAIALTYVQVKIVKKWASKIQSIKTQRMIKVLLTG